MASRPRTSRDPNLAIKQQQDALNVAIKQQEGHPQIQDALRKQKDALGKIAKNITDTHLLEKDGGNMSAPTVLHAGDKGSQLK